MSLFFKSLTLDVLMGLKQAQGTICDVLYQFFTVHGPCTKASIAVVVHDTSLFIVMDSDSSATIDNVESMYGSIKSASGPEVWRPINTASLMLPSNGSKDVSFSKLQTFCRIDGTSFLPKVIAAPTDYNLAVYHDRIKTAVVAEWSKTYDFFWPRLCPEDPIVITIDLPSSKMRNFTVTPWTSSRASKTVKYPSIITVQGFCKWTSSTLFELKIDGIDHDIVVRNFGSTTAEESLKTKSTWALNLTDTHVGSFSPPRPPRRRADAAMGAKAGAADGALEAAAGAGGFAGAGGAGGFAGAGAAGGFEEPRAKRRKVRPSSPVVGVMYNSAPNGATRSDMDRSYLTPEMLVRIKNFTLVCSRISSAIVSLYAKDSVPSNWTTGVYREASKPGKIIASFKELAFGMPQSMACNSTTSCEVGYTVGPNDSMIPVLAFNVDHPTWHSKSNIMKNSFLLDAACTLWSKITSIDRSIISSLAMQLDIEFEEAATAASAAAPPVPLAAAVGAGFSAAAAAAAAAPAAAAAACHSALSPEAEAVISSLWHSMPPKQDDMFGAASLLSMHAGPSHEDETFGQSGPAYPTVPAFTPRTPTSNGQNYSVLFKAWLMLATSGEMPYTASGHHPSKFSFIDKLKKKIRGGTFAKPRDGSGTRGGARNRDPLLKKEYLLQELLDASSCGVTHEEVFDIIDHKVPPHFLFFTSTGSTGGFAASMGAIGASTGGFAASMGASGGHFLAAHSSYGAGSYGAGYGGAGGAYGAGAAAGAGPSGSWMYSAEDIAAAAAAAAAAVADS